jgi:hypothetical protein
MNRVIASMDRIGAAGALLAAVAAPCCFPLFAALAGALGLGVLARFETTALYAFQAFGLLAVIGLALSYRTHRRLGPVAVGLLGLSAVASSFYWSWSTALLYAGLAAIVAATVCNWFCTRRRIQREPILTSVITCPSCGHRAEETMPTNACLFFYDCAHCNARMKPKPGDCCVFCSYGSVPCPPIQEGETCCA